MKKEILNNLNGLMNASDLEEKVNLQIRALHLIQAANFSLDVQEQKQEIVSGLNGCIEQPENVYRQIIASHIAFIESQNVS